MARLKTPRLTLDQLDESVSKLRAQRQEFPELDAIMTHCRGLGDAKVVTVDELVENLSFSRRRVTACSREVERQRFVDLIPGRGRGGKSRLEAVFPLSALGAAWVRPARPASAPRVVEHSLVLRPDFRATITLPLNVTQQEADRLADWVQNLPFEGRRRRVEARELLDEFRREIRAEENQPNREGEP